MTSETISRRTYLRTAVGLIVLLIATAGANWIDLGPLAFAVSFAIATAKALLVIVFFMEIRISPRLLWLFAAAGFFWLAILIVLTLTDVLTRVPVHLPLDAFL